SAPERREVYVIEVAIPRSLRTIGRVVSAAPNGILQPEPRRVLQRVRDDLIAQGDALGALGIGDHHVKREAVGMPSQGVGANSADVVNLGKNRTDATSDQDGVHLQALLWSDAGGKQWRDDPEPRC